MNQPLRADDTIIAFIDLQEGIVNVAATNDQGRLRLAVAALADLAGIFSMPVAVTCVPTTTGTVAPVLAELGARFPDAAQHVRTTADALDDPPFRATLEAGNRRTLILAGVVTEVAIGLAAMAAVRLGYNVIVAVDACGGLDARSEAATFTRMSALGIALSSAPAIAAELAGDFRSERGRAAMRVLQSMVSTHAHDHSGHDHDHEPTRITPD